MMCLEQIYVNHFASLYCTRGLGYCM